MAITDEDTVLVLGAGVSVPFDLPLGGDIIAKILKRLDSERNQLLKVDRVGRMSRMDAIGGAAHSSQAFSTLSIHGTIFRRHLRANNDLNTVGLQNDLEKIESFAELLNGQTSETIDDFIVENPSYSFISKIGIATQFFLSSYILPKGAPVLNSFSCRSFSGDEKIDRNWIHLLINMVRHGIRSGNVTKENKIKIVTFNYDKILEHVFEMQFSNTETNYSHYTNYVEIIHVHGECGELGDIEGVAPSQVCLEWANGIHVVNEPDVPGNILVARDQAKDLIQSAKEIYFCGFSFSGPNCRLLGLGEPNQGLGRRLISFCNYDGNIGISKTVRKYEYLGQPNTAYSEHVTFTEIDEVSGTIQAPLGVTDWLRLGSFGEPPA